MAYVATYIYWAIVALWLTVLSSVIYYYVRNPRAFGTTRLLLTVIGIDTVRNIAENAISACTSADNMACSQIGPSRSWGALNC
jgi:hypothetical protein